MSSFLDFLNISLQRIRLNISDWNRWNIQLIQNTEPQVYYGIDYLPSEEEKVSGGIVKCMDLVDRFTNTRKNSNILYLVSSALPNNSAFLIKRAKKSGVKLIVNQNGVAYNAWHGEGWQKTNLMLKNVLQSADYIIYQSNFSKMMSDEYLGEARAPSSILHNSVNTDLFYPPIVKNHTKNLLVAGTHNHAYRIRIVLEALSLLKNETKDPYFLHIAGPLRWKRDISLCFNEVISWCKELKIDSSVSLIGQYSQKQAVHIFQNADILLHLQYNDVCPRLLVESMASGVPVVFSRSGGSPELVGDDAGFGLDVPFDVDKEHYPTPLKLAEGILYVTRNLAIYSSAARNRAVKYFDVKNWIRCHENIFKEALS